MLFRLVLVFFAVLALGCVRFDDYPVGDLCEKAERDEQGRAVRYPEWRICPALGGGGTGPGPDHEENLGGTQARE